jgi:proteasome component ECM29
MTQEQDLALLEQAYGKFGIASDEQFPNLTATLLPPLLEKLDSPHNAIRTKVLKILSHINQRYKAELAWKLPVEGLLKLLQTLPASNALGCNFCVGYILSALEREDKEVQKRALLRVMELLPNLNQGCQIHVLTAFVSSVDTIRTKGSLELRTDLFKFISNESTKRSFLNFMIDFLLYLPQVPTLRNPSPISPGHSLQSEKLLKTTSLSGIQSQLPDTQIVVQIGLYSLTQLAAKKIGILTFFSENLDIFSDSDVYAAAVIATTDSINEVQRHGEHLFKRLSKEPLSQKSSLVQLFQLFLGQKQETGLNDPPAPAAAPAQGGAAQAPDDGYAVLRSPVSLATRTLILDLLCKSSTATTQTPHCIQLFFSALFGSSNTAYPKLQISCLGFAQGMIRNFPDAQIKVFGAILLSGLMKYMKWLREVEQGVDNPTLASIAASKNMESLKIATLHAFSALGRRIPTHFATNIALIEELMQDLRDNKSVVLVSATQETLTSLCPTASSISDAVRNRLKMIFKSNFELQTPAEDNAMNVDEQSAQKDLSKPTVSSKFVSQFYANRCFPFSDEFCRYINLLGVNETNTQVVQEAKRGLKPFKVVENDIVPLAIGDESIQWPSFSDMVTLILSKRHPSAEAQNVLAFATPTFQSLISFLHTLLKHHRASHSSSPPNPDHNLIHSSLTGFFSLLQEAITLAPTQPISHLASEQFLETIQFIPLNVTGTAGDAQMLRSNPVRSLASLSTSIQALMTTLLSGSLKPDTMKLVARIIGILVLQDLPSRRKVLDACFHALDQHKTTSLSRDIVIGAMNGVSAVIASGLRVGLDLPDTLKDLHHATSAIQAAAEAAAKEKLLSVGGNAYSLIIAACDAIGSMGRWTSEIASISSPQLSVTPDDSKSMATDTNNTKTVLDTVLGLVKHFDSGISIAASFCLSHLCLGDRSLITRDSILEALLGTFVIKSEESHFSIGEALSILTYGWHATVSADHLVLSEVQEQKQREAQMNGAAAIEREETCMKVVLNKVLKEYFLSARPDTRMASAIWLLTILKNCGAHPEIISQLKSIQAGYQLLLSDPSEILQEVAGKGLSQVYELGDEETKKDLVNGLVGALQKGASTFKVTADSEIFSSGAMGTTPSGDKLTTYRELVTLASEMNQPDLIYKFMQLSAHNALWNSKKGAAFATGELAQRAKSQIEPHLPQLVPKLYRASFDPNPKIAHSMHSIMTTLVPDHHKDMITKLIKPVLRDLLDHCVDTQWRTREASCNALADVLPAREFMEVADELKELWDRCFRTLDDVKESVRKAAESFQKSLSTLTLRLCDPSYTNRDHGRQAIEIALPHLLSKGIVSSVKEVRFISVNMLQKLAQVASFLLKPHIAELIPVLLLSLQTLDSAQLNYLEQHSSSYGISAELFDEARVTISKSSPVHATIDTCVQQVDTENITVLAPKLAALLTADNHISTRAGTASVITQLALTKPEAVKLTAHRLMLALKKGIGARSQLVRQAYGYAMGQLSRCAKPKTLETVVTGLLKSYKESTPEEADLRSAIAEALLELSKASVTIIEYASTPSTPVPSTDAEAGESSTISAATRSSSSMDVGLPASPPPTVSKASHAQKSASTEGRASTPVLAPFYPLVVPVVFLARFDAKDETSKVFNKIWEECGVSLALYVPETVETFSAALGAPSWQMKQQGAKAMAKFAETLNLTQFSTHASQLLQLLLNGIKGRTWTGKESLLDALSKLVVCCAELWTPDSQVSGAADNKITQDEIIKAISTEVMRKTLDYKKAALTCLTDVLITFGKITPNYDSLSKLQDLLVEQATTIHTSEGESEVTSSSKGEQKEDESALSRSIRQMAIQALCAAFPHAVAVESQKKHLPTILKVLVKTMTSANHQYTLKVAILNNLKSLFPKIAADHWDEIVTPDLWRQIQDHLLFPSLRDTKYTVVRSAACFALTEMLLQSQSSSLIISAIGDITKAVNDADSLGQSASSNEKLLTLISGIRGQNF